MRRRPEDRDELIVVVYHRSLKFIFFLDARMFSSSRT
jgi:hypothetical protein